MADIAQRPWIHSVPLLLLLIYVAYPVSSLLFLWTQNPTTHYFKCSTIMNTFPFIVMTPTLMTTLCFHADVTGVFWCSILIYVRKWTLKVLPRLPLLQRKWEAPCVCAYVLTFMQWIEWFGQNELCAWNESLGLSWKGTLKIICCTYWQTYTSSFLCEYMFGLLARHNCAQILVRKGKEVFQGHHLMYIARKGRCSGPASSLSVSPMLI